MCFPAPFYTLSKIWTVSRVFLRKDNVVLWICFPFFAVFINSCTGFHEAAKMTIVHTMRSKIYYSITKDLNSRGFIPKFVTKIIEGFMSLKKEMIVIFHIACDNFVYTLKFYFLDYVLEYLKYFLISLYCTITPSNTTIFILSGSSHKLP